VGERVDLIRDLDRPNGWLLSVEGVAQSYVDLDDPGHLEFEYVAVLADVIDAWLPSGATAEVVHLGGGAGTLARYVAATRPGSEQLVVEADPEVASVAIDRLGLLDVAGVTLVVADARETVDAQPDDSADVMVSDVFDGSTVPSSVMSLEALREVRRALRPGGVYLANIADATTFDFARPVLATLRSTFDHVGMLAEPSVMRGRRFGNLVLVGADIPLPSADLRRRAARAVPPVRLVEGDALATFVGTAVPQTDDALVTAPEVPDWAHPRDNGP
jgi:spermidine synthase